MNTFAPAVRRPLPNLLALWHLLSLDAPTVSVTWTIFVARASHAALPPAIPIAMFLAVWAIYAADRILDLRPVPVTTLQPGEAPPHHALPTRPKFTPEHRHRFHEEHRQAFTVTIIAASLALLPLTLAIPPHILHRYLVLATALLLWFLTIHVFLPARPLPKEFVPGPFFAAAIFIPIWNPSLGPAALCIALLCTLNCLYIHAWEQPHAPDHFTTRPALRLLPVLSILAITLPLLLLFVSPTYSPILLAISLAAALLLLLNILRPRLDATNLRAAADLALLTPLLFAPFLR